MGMTVHLCAAPCKSAIRTVRRVRRGQPHARLAVGLCIAGRCRYPPSADAGVLHLREASRMRTSGHRMSGRCGEAGQRLTMPVRTYVTTLSKCRHALAASPS